MRWLVVALAAPVALLVAAQVGEATVILDQDYFPTGNYNIAGSFSNGTTFGRAQTFTVGIAGVLDSVEYDAVGTPTLLRILDTVGGVPIGGAGGSVILASSASFTSVGNVHRFDLSSAGLVVNVGDVLAIEPFAAAGPAWWNGSQSVSYPDGSDYYFNTNTAINNWTPNSPSDFSFRTYVDVIPEPATLSLLGLGLLAVARRRRKR